MMLRAMSGLQQKSRPILGCILLVHCWAVEIAAA
jgi:hypothetical protein